MAYNFATDFVGLWRAVTGGVEKGEMPGLDFVVAALARAGILNPLVVSGSPPVVNQDTTAWFRTASPDYAAEGALYLWDSTTSDYLPATPALFLEFLGAAGSGGFLTIFAGDGVPDDAIGANGDFYLRLDAPGGIYGPKSAGMWPPDPIPGTSYSQISEFLDVLGTTQGDIVYRDASAWTVLAPGIAGQILSSGGTAANPSWISSSGIVSAGLDDIGNVQGDILYRNATVWTVLAPGTAGQILQSGGAGANPSWVTNSSSYTLNSAEVDAAFGATIGGVLTRSSGGWINNGQGAVGTILVGQGPFTPIWLQISEFIDDIFGGTQGSVLYRGATAWTALAPGVSGQFLQTLGSGANPAWATVPSFVPSGGAIGSYGLSQIANSPPLDGSGFSYPGTWVSVSLVQNVDFNGVPGNLYLNQRVA